MKRDIKTKIKVDLGKYVNIDTGESMMDEFDGGLSVSIEERGDYVSLSSSDYAVVDSTTLRYLSSILSYNDIGKITYMSLTTKTPLNILYNNNIPHSNKTLQSYLEVKSESSFLKFLKKLIKAGVLYQLKGRIYGDVRVIYMLNPYVSRKRRTFDNKVFDIFSKFDEGKIDVNNNYLK